MFCVNSAVYSFEMGSQSSYAAKAATVLMDQLCLVAADKSVAFFEMQGMKFDEVRSGHEYSL